MVTKLQETAKISGEKTDIWNDSCSVKELTYSLENSACVGATSNPVIVGEVLEKEFDEWKARILEIIKNNPEDSEEDITWKVIKEITKKGADLLLPIFRKEKGMKGRMSIQTNPKNWRNAEKMWKQAVEFNELGENIIVKIPVTKAGVKAIEETTYHGVNINATVCFSVAQCIAVAEAVELGMKRRAAEDKDNSHITPVCTLMVGRQDDWLKVVAAKKGIIVDPWILEWAGVACIKNAYKIFQARKYRTRLLSAAFRNHLQWSELIGADMVITIPYKWQVNFNKSDVEVKKRIDNPVDPAILESLAKHFPEEWKKGFDENGMKVEEFDTYGAVQRTLRSFIEGYDKLVARIRDLMIPNPDK
jgi:transaldolase